MSQLVVNCPHCDQSVAWDTLNKFRPFCSERCALLDLGSWADESNRIDGDADHSDVNSEDLYE